jgi:prevent-host-death family protein
MKGGGLDKHSLFLYSFIMKTTYSITEAQAKFPALVKESADHAVVITRRNETVGYLLSTERMEAILETMELLANPDAMKAVRDFEAGTETYIPLSDLTDAE